MVFANVQAEKSNFFPYKSPNSRYQHKYRLIGQKPVLSVKLMPGSKLCRIGRGKSSVFDLPDGPGMIGQDIFIKKF